MDALTAWLYDRFWQAIGDGRLPAATHACPVCGELSRIVTLNVTTSRQPGVCMGCVVDIPPIHRPEGI